MKENITFTTSTRYDISDEDIRQLYLLMSLIQFPYDCSPNYDSDAIIRRLRNDFNRYNTEITRLCLENPNNLVLNQIRNFVQRHYGHLRKITKEAQQ